MRISASLRNAYEFACHSKACAPPPAGRGGSIKGGSAARYTSEGPAVRKGFNKGIAARRAGESSATNKTTFVSKYGTPSVTDGKWGGGPAYGKNTTTGVVRAGHSDQNKGKTQVRKKKSDPIGDFMTKMAKKSREDYWGPKGPPEGKPLFSSLKKEVIGNKTDAAADVMARIARWKAKED